MRCAAGELSFHDHRIDDPAAVVDHDIAQNTHAAGLDIHLHLDGVASPAIGKRVRQEALHAFEPGLELARHRIAGNARHGFGDFAQRQPAPRRAGDLDPPVAQLEVAHAHLQQVGGDLERLVADCDCREMDRGAGRHGLAAGEAALTVGDDRGVAGGNRDAVGRNVELLRAEPRVFVRLAAAQAVVHVGRQRGGGERV